MIITAQTVLTDEEAHALRGLDASFSTDHIYDITGSPDGTFTMAERVVTPPFSKVYCIAAVGGQMPPWDLTIMASLNHRLVGMAATTFQAWNARQVVNELHVAPDMRGRGLARRLLGRVRDTARVNDARELWLETQNVNWPGIQAYRHMGFHVSGIDTSRYGPPHEAEVAVFMSAPVIGE